jgi:hypothetical protein
MGENYDHCDISEFEYISKTVSAICALQLLVGEELSRNGSLPYQLELCLNFEFFAHGGS